jgi:hypothetical protein
MTGKYLHDVMRDACRVKLRDAAMSERVKGQRGIGQTRSRH